MGLARVHICLHDGAGVHCSIGDFSSGAFVSVMFSDWQTVVSLIIVAGAVVWMLRRLFALGQDQFWLRIV